MMLGICTQTDIPIFEVTILRWKNIEIDEISTFFFTSIYRPERGFMLSLPQLVIRVCKRYNKCEGGRGIVISSLHVKMINFHRLC